MCVCVVCMCYGCRNTRHSCPMSRKVLLYGRPPGAAVPNSEFWEKTTVVLRELEGEGIRVERRVVSAHENDEGLCVGKSVRGETLKRLLRKVGIPWRVNFESVKDCEEAFEYASPGRFIVDVVDGNVTFPLCVCRTSDFYVQRVFTSLTEAVAEFLVGANECVGQLDRVQARLLWDIRGGESESDTSDSDTGGNSDTGDGDGGGVVQNATLALQAGRLYKRTTFRASRVRDIVGLIVVVIRHVEGCDVMRI